MQRLKQRIKSRIWRVNRQLLLALLCSLCIVMLIAGSPLRAAQPTNQIDAKTLTQQGFVQFDRGNATSALKLWHSASELYRKQGDLDGQIGNVINQSLALKALGQLPQMCQILARDALGMSDRFCFRQLQFNRANSDSFQEGLARVQLNPIRLLALQHLGTALQLIGDLSNAKIALKAVLLQTDLKQQGEAQLALGNVEQASFIQLRDLFARSDALDSLGNGVIQLKFQALATFNCYDQAAQTVSLRSIAQINQFSFLANLNRWLLTQQNNNLPEIQDLSRIVNDRLRSLTPSVLKINFAEFPSIDGVYARLNLARSLTHLIQDGGPFSLDQANQLATDALSRAKSLSNLRATSYSLGTLGQIARQQGDFQRARSRFDEAMGIAQAIRASDVAYEWQQALAQIAQQRGDSKGAIAYYRAAINSLDQVRNDLLPIAADVQFSFREQVEPVYRSYMSLLLTESSTPDLPQVISTYEQLKIAELENFLQCGRLPLVSLSKRRPDAVVFYILNLPNSIGIIAQAPNRSPQYYSANADAVRNANDGLTFNLQTALQSNQLALPDESTLKGYAQTLYQQIIAPAERGKILTPNTSIVFVLDNTLQDMPVSLLHNGETYLINRFPIRLSLGSEAPIPASPNSKRLTALVAALSKASPSFNDPRISQTLLPLDKVATEVQSIRAAIPATQILNEQFTLSQLEDRIRQNQYNIVHIATHGQFSSMPDKTFVMAWDKLITAPQLSVLLRSRINSSIDLLVLSACQTARGDTRSTLGLAGVTVQSGARSTIASLWLVDDAATALLVKNFYENLKHGKSKAVALQQAQLKLQKTAFSNPYFWSSFVLVGEA